MELFDVSVDVDAVESSDDGANCKGASELGAFRMCGGEDSHNSNRLHAEWADAPRETARTSRIASTKRMDAGQTLAIVASLKRERASWASTRTVFAWSPLPDFLEFSPILLQQSAAILYL